MNDRELLELAAKAAGYYSLLSMPMSRTEVSYVAEEFDGGPLTPWNPLTDDGDALRLAVKIGAMLTIGPCQIACSTIAGALRGNFIKEDCIRQDYGFATRRAIVRAAAEIGRAMP